ncbi:sigma-70 family RNA polymerase sigma factor [Nonomuraea dietziae]|uniref:sigma-70 family RNA polymerase sigma factor n=1 Tax=Nonomuraea dietziae TaxID=65515 RepID=UPI0031D03227
MKAINGYDAGLGHEFRGYAGHHDGWGGQTHFLATMPGRQGAARLPGTPFGAQPARLRSGSVLLQRSPTIAELAAHMQLTHEQVLLTTLEAAAAYSTYSLDARLVSDEDGCLGDLIADQDDCLDVFIDVQAVKPLIDALPSRERNILLLALLRRSDPSRDRRRGRHLPDARNRASARGSRRVAGRTRGRRRTRRRMKERGWGPDDRIGICGGLRGRATVVKSPSWYGAAEMTGGGIDR